MRRGLMAWDKNELPREALEARIANLRHAMQAQQLDALIAYTNIARPAAVHWISGFTPYWSEGLYLLPLDGEPQFATALSKRVAEWIGSVMPVGQVIPTPQPGATLGKLIAAQGQKKIGIVELDDLPAPQARGLMEGHEADLVDATALFDACRSLSDAAERALFAKAAALAQASLKQATECTGNPRGMIAACEAHARLQGAEDVFISIAPDLSRNSAFQRTDTLHDCSEHFALRLSLAFKGVWVRCVESFSANRDVAAQFTSFKSAFETLSLSDANPATALTQFADAHGMTTGSWQIEQPRGSYPLVTAASSHSPGAGSWNTSAPAVLTAAFKWRDMTWRTSATLDGLRILQSKG